MLTDKCKTCKHCLWMVGIGFGVRCSNDLNQKYKQEGDSHQNLSVLISRVPECDLFEDYNTPAFSDR